MVHDIPQTDSSRRRPKKLLFAAVALGAPGLALLAFAGIWMIGGIFNLVNERSTPLTVPGTTVVAVEEAGTQFIWGERTGSGGWDVSLASLDVRVVEAASGREIPVRGRSGTTLTVGNVQRYSIASFDAPAPGDYEVTVAAGGNAPPLTVTRSPMRMFGMILIGTLAAGFVGLLLTVGGLICLIVWIASLGGGHNSTLR